MNDATPERSRSRLAAALLLAAVVAVAATIFGIGYAPESHHAGGEHAETAEHAEEEGGHAEEEEAESSHAEDEEDDDLTAGVIASSILISLAGVAVVPLGMVPARRGGAELPRGTPLAASAGAGAVVVGLLSIGAAVVHFAVIAQHFDEWWLTGSFFVGIALFQLAWGLLVLVRPSALAYAAGAIVNALIVVTWIVSRTSGVPVGPHAGEAETVGVPDTLATAFEIALVLVLVGLLVGRSPRLPAPLASRAVQESLSALVVASLTAVALVTIA